jgi:hypothetical protein
MKISDMIKSLEQLKTQVGDLEVLVAGDPAGNTFADLGKKVIAADLIDKKTVALFPVRKFYADEIGR